jgi:hypothetical protein
MEDVACPETAFMERAKALAGTGLLRFLKDEAPRAAVAGRLALTKPAIPCGALRPLYLRAPQAERERLAREAAADVR